MTDKVFFVELPIAGTISTYVKASSKEEAIQKAIDDPGHFESVQMTELWELEEWDVYEHLFQGNITYVDHVDATAKESDDFDLEDFE
jgi:hypothetical protein